MVYPHKASIYIILYYIFFASKHLTTGRKVAEVWMAFAYMVIPASNKRHPFRFWHEIVLNRDIKDIYRCRNQATLRNMAQYALKWGEFLELMFRALALRNSKWINEFLVVRFIYSIRRLKAIPWNASATERFIGKNSAVKIKYQD